MSVGLVFELCLCLQLDIDLEIELSERVVAGLTQRLRYTAYSSFQ